MGNAVVIRQRFDLFFQDIVQFLDDFHLIVGRKKIQHAFPGIGIDHTDLQYVGFFPDIFQRIHDGQKRQPHGDDAPAPVAVIHHPVQFGPFGKCSDLPEAFQRRPFHGMDAGSGDGDIGTVFDIETGSVVRFFGSPALKGNLLLGMANMGGGP